MAADIASVLARSCQSAKPISSSNAKEFTYMPLTVVLAKVIWVATITAAIKKGINQSNLTFRLSFIKS